jgi:hypothetical protein
LKFYNSFTNITNKVDYIRLAVFTVIVTFQQESVAKTNHDVDLRIAGEQM